MSMDPISRALHEIMFSIPGDLLGMAFSQSTVYGNVDNRSMEARIRDTIIEGKVVPDCQMVSGEQVIVPVNSCTTRIIQNGIIYYAPLEVTGGRHLKSVISIGSNLNHGFNSSHVHGDMGYNSISSLGHRFANSVRGGGYTENHMVDIIPPNGILVRGQELGLNEFIRCYVFNDELMSNLKIHNIPLFQEMAVYATKWYIHTRLMTTLGEGRINGGSLNGYTRQLVDEYASAEEEYKQRVKLFSGAMVDNDVLTQEQMLMAQFGL